MLDLTSFHAQFREETAENVRIIAAGLLSLERTPGDRSTLDAIFRAAHTIKGAARMLGFGDVAGVSHALESLLDALRAGHIVLTSELNDLLLRANDATQALSEATVPGQPQPPDMQPLILALEAAARLSTAAAAPPPAFLPAASPSPSAPVALLPEPVVVATPAPVVSPAELPLPSAPAPQRATIRVRVDRLERLLAVAGELSVGRQVTDLHLDRLRHLSAEIADLQRAVLQLERDLPTTRQPAIIAAGARWEHQFHAAATGVTKLATGLRDELNTYCQHITTTHVLIEEFEAEIFAARLVPVATVFASLPRAIREVSRSLGKQVELTVTGEQTEADRKVLDGLADPLLHLIRNAVDHGLEDPAERASAGKPPAGQLQLAARTIGSQLEIVVSDDGRGMDPAALRAAAVRKRLIEPAMAAVLTDEEAFELILLPGFSTNSIITDISGRGVGMDVVASRVAEFGGTIQIHSHLGTGTTFILSLPVSLMTSEVILFAVGGQTWALPAIACSSLVRIDPATVQTLEQQPVVELDGRTVPLLRLDELLDLPPAPGSGAMLHGLVVGTARPVIILVDHLIDECEVVIKPIGPLLRDHHLVVGAAPLHDGSLALVLNPQALIDRARRLRRRELPPPGITTRRLMVADDSFTTRQLLRSILQSAGYHVESAVDGDDALSQLKSSPCDLVVSDVEMPHLDGFGLTASIRGDPALSHIPVVLVTSLHSDEHRRAGAAAGAQAYIVKGEFDQNNLIQTIQQLVG
ncbi:MAG: hybrid sensor histidine kinase/response regulator [Herpetosiphon sp.]